MFNHIFDLHCPDCGETISENEQYCPNCGTDLDASIQITPSELKATAKKYLEKAQRKYERGLNQRGTLSDCELALEHDPFSADAHNLRGLILDDMGRTREAIEAYKEALQLNPGHKDAIANLRDAEKEQLDGDARYQLPNNYETDFQPQVHNNIEIEDSLWPDIKKFIKIGYVILLLLAGGKLLLNLGYSYLIPKATLILEPDFTLVSSVTQEELQEAVDILTERSYSLGYSRVTFTVENNEVIVKIPANINAEEFIAKIDDIGLVEFVDFGEAKIAEGTIVTTDLDFRYLPEGQDTKWHTVMTNHEIETASMTQDQIGVYQVSFTLTEEGTKIFAEHTSQNINTYLGIVLDKVIISVPIINSAIPDGQGVIQGNFTKETADELAGILNSSPLPFPIRIKK